MEPFSGNVSAAVLGHHVMVRKSKTCGIYSITSPSGNFYIGSSANVEHRKSQHFAGLRAGRHHSTPLQRAANRHGVESLTHKLLCECPREHLRELEQLVIDMGQPRYNATQDTRTPLDHLWTQAWFRQKMAAVNTIRMAKLWADPKCRAAKSESSAARSAPVLRRPDVAKLAAEASGAALRELWKTPEHRAKIVDASSRELKKRWTDPEFRRLSSERSKLNGKLGMAAMRSNPDNLEKIRQNGIAHAKNLKTPEARANNVAGIRASVSRKVRCIETGQVFDAITDAAKAVGVKHQNISAVVRGKAKSSAGFTWEYC